MPSSTSNHLRDFLVVVSHIIIRLVTCYLAASASRWILAGYGIHMDLTKANLSPSCCIHSFTGPFVAASAPGGRTCVLQPTSTILSCICNGVHSIALPGILGHCYPPSNFCLRDVEMVAEAFSCRCLRSLWIVHVQ